MHGPQKVQYPMAAFTEKRRFVSFPTTYYNESNSLLMTIGRNVGSIFFMVSSWVEKTSLYYDEYLCSVLLIWLQIESIALTQYKRVKKSRFIKDIKRLLSKEYSRMIHFHQLMTYRFF